MPEDRRLIALSDVRDLTVLRDDDGPHPRRCPSWSTCSTPAWTRCARPARPTAATRALDWNRVLLYVWPVVDLPLDELDSVVRVLAPRTEGLGLEQVLVQFRTPGPAAGEPTRAACCGCPARRAPG